jgi:hypothetical protein
MDLGNIMSMAANVGGQAMAAAQAAQQRADFFSKTVFVGGRWDVNLAGSVAVSGEILRGRVHFEPDSPLQARRLRVRLVGIEMAAYDRTVSHREPNSAGSSESQTDRLMRPTELGQFMTAIDLAAPPAPGAPAEIDFAMPIDGWALPTVEMPGNGSPVYEIKWAFECAAVVDVNDPSPSAFFRAPLLVTRAPDASTAGLAPGAVDAEAASDGSPTCAISLSPSPLVAGAPFTGHSDLRGPDLGKMRVVIEAEYGTNAPDDVHSDGVAITFGGMRSGAMDVSASGVSGTVELWRGQLKGAPGDITFEGSAPSVNVVEGPNGHVKLRLSLVEDRRLMPDRNWRRPIAISTKPQG